MQTIKLTAPDGRSERWDVQTTYLALKLWYSYLSNPDQQEPNSLAKLVGEFIGDDLSKVRCYYIYRQAVRYNLFRKLAKLTDQQENNISYLLFVMKSLFPHSPYMARGREHKKQERKRQQFVKDIKAVTGDSLTTLMQLIDLAHLFVDGVLSYDHMKG
jgi:hypothetical protein